MTKLETLKNKIQNWNKKNINELKSNIDQLRSLDENYFNTNIDVTDLQTMPLEEYDTSYPIWSMDIGGSCLVGESLSHIEHITDIITTEEK